MENIFPNAKQFDTMNEMLAAIASNTGGISVKSFADVQALTRTGLHSKLFTVADQFQCDRATSVSASIGESTGITAVQISDTQGLIEKLGSHLNGTFVLTYDGNAWYNQIGASVKLSNWGITVTGTPAANDEIVINITATALTFDVLDFDKHKPKNSRLAHTVDLCMHNVFAYSTIPFSAPQLMYATKAQVDACYESWKAYASGRPKNKQKVPGKMLKRHTHKLVLEMDKFYKSLWEDSNEISFDQGTVEA